MTAALAGCAMPALAQAQDADAPRAEAAPAEEGEIIVTGSRVERAGYDAPTPTTIVGQAEIELRAPIRTIELLDDLPQFYGNANPSSQGVGSTGTGGQSFANMRALGANRTLVLFNGQRFVPTTGIGTVDIALLPEILIRRVDVVTGGASAAYGSDAVAGVVNFAVDNGYRGLKGVVQAGVTDEGDGGFQKAGFAWGGQLAEGFSVVLGGEYFRSDGVPPNSRAQDAVDVIPNPAYVPGNGQPALLLRKYAYEGRSTKGGLIVGGALANIQFLPGGATSTYTPCSSLSSSALQFCDSRQNLPYKQAFQYLDAPQERYNGYGRLAYEVSSGTTIQADLLYAHSDTNYNSVPPYTATYGLRTIYRDNAYLPASVRQLMVSKNVSSFSLGSGFDFLYPVHVIRDNSVWRGSLGFESELGGSWKLDGYAAYGASVDNFALEHDTINDKFNMALDAVVNPANGQIVCRSTLTNPGNGCVPINVFGGDQVTSAAKEYIVGTAWARLVSKQFSAALNLSAEPVSTWAGPVSIAVGIEYRDENVRQKADDISAVKGFANGNPQSFAGSADVKEAYGEIVVPLAKDASFARTLELNAAGRVTDYSYSGTVTTWKVGLNYEPLEGLRFRGTRSRDIRAPNITELFAGGLRTAPTVVDPTTGVQQRTIGYPVGNPNLTPEIADTTAAGLVVEPMFLRGFQASIDYYRINIRDAVGAVSAQNTLDFCFAGDAVYCALVARDNAGALVSIDLPKLNIGTLRTSGIDFEARYALPLGGSKQLIFRGLATRLLKYKTQSDVSTTVVDQLGAIQPRWSGNFTLNYRTDQTSVFLSARYLGSAVFSNEESSKPDLNDIKAQVYFNATVEQTIDLGDTEMRLFLNVKNLFDKAPPYGFEFDGGNYDLIGRRFVAGVRFSL
ncbi:TonB-dependent receptor domain-containing protein [Sphingomonas canadensis]|nr:TonB-dependent receptor [Sphingomonas canadensis]